MKFITTKRAKIVIIRITNLDQGDFLLGVTRMHLSVMIKPVSATKKVTSVFK